MVHYQKNGQIAEPESSAGHVVECVPGVPGIMPFDPQGDTAAVSAGTSSAAAALSGAGSSIELQNGGSDTVFVALGDQHTVATTRGYPVLAGSRRVIRYRGQAYVAAITASGSAALYATVGNGS